MCVMATVNGVQCNTIGDLRKALIDHRVVIESNWSDPSDDACLCPVDMPATIREANATNVRRDEVFNEWSFDVKERSCDDAGEQAE